MSVVFANNASTTLVSDPDTGSTLLTVANSSVFPPVVQRTAITAPSGGGTSYGIDANTTSAITFNTSTLTDLIQPRNFVNYGTTQDTTNFKYGGSSRAGGYITSGNYLSDISVTTGDFTVELFIRNTINNQIVFDHGNTNTGGHHIYLYGGKFYYGYNNGGTYLSSTASTCADGNWHHWAISRESGVMRMYVDGTYQTKVTYTGNIGTTSVAAYFGCYSSPVSYAWSGNYDEFRFSKVARYTSETIIQVPTASWGDPTDPIQYATSQTDTGYLGKYFYAKITEGSNYEYVKVVNNNTGTNVLTVVRGQEGSTPFNFSAGAKITIVQTKQQLADIESEVFAIDYFNKTRR